MSIHTDRQQLRAFEVSEDRRVAPAARDFGRERGGMHRASPPRADCFARSASLIWAPLSQDLGSQREDQRSARPKDPPPTKTHHQGDPGNRCGLVGKSGFWWHPATKALGVPASAGQWCHSVWNETERNGTPLTDFVAPFVQVRRNPCRKLCRAPLF